MSTRALALPESWCGHLYDHLCESLSEEHRVTAGTRAAASATAGLEQQLLAELCHWNDSYIKKLFIIYTYIYI